MSPTQRLSRRITTPPVKLKVAYAQPAVSRSPPISCTNTA
jgi:hypothetical protein